jgi:hypothetical protein
MTDDIALTDLPRKLREITGGKALVPSYRVLYGRVLDGTVPAERRNGRWQVSESVARDLAKGLLGAGRRP